ncbi:MAG: hypothetical protein U0974_05955, partial [Gemmatimonadales bacterium]|nr:hypothetical protein [Gemmatimonadales bacterium]MDZ4389254.1 hypothetical protein [Gemmatimonadales bacterium]
ESPLVAGRWPVILLLTIFTVACSGTVTGLEDHDSGPALPPPVAFQKVNCEGPDVDPDCAGSVGGGLPGAGTGATSMSYTAPGNIFGMGSYKQFPYSLIGTSPWAYLMSVSISTGASAIQGDAKWGTQVVSSFFVADGGGFPIQTTGGAGSPSIRAMAAGPLAVLVFFTCDNCQ